MDERRIYTAAEARALREAAMQGLWEVGYDAANVMFVTQSGAPHADVATDVDACEVDARLMAAAPDLAASVEHYAAEVERLTRECRDLDEAAIIARDEARDDRAARDAAESALRYVWDVVAPGAEDFPRVAEGDDEVADAAKIGAAAERLAADSARLRAAVREVVSAEDDASRHASTVDRHLRYHAAWDALCALTAEVPE